MSLLPLSLRIVRGHSMEPFLRDGSRVVVLHYFFSKPKAGDVVVFRSGGREFVKRIVAAREEMFAVKGDNDRDSLKMPPVGRKSILGKVIFSY